MEQQDLLSNYRKDLKERILVTSMRAFKERGIRSVRMDDIATTLGISKRTMCLYQCLPFVGFQVVGICNAVHKTIEKGVNQRLLRV